MKRDAKLDYMKGVLILLVVYGHCMYWLSNDYTHRWNMYIPQFIYTFHMPLFVFLCGYFFSLKRHKPFFETIIDKFKRLIIPHVFFNIIWIIPVFLLWDWYGHFITRGYYVGHITLNNIFQYLTMFWFLWCIFLSCCISNIVYSILPRPHLCNMMIAVFLYITEALYPHIFLFTESHLGNMYIFFALGLILYGKESFIKSKFCVICSSIVYIIYLWLLFSESPYYCFWNEKIGKIAAVVCSFNIINLLYNTSIYNKIFLKISRYSLFIYIYHFTILYPLIGIIQNDQTGDYIAIINFIISILTVLILSGIAKNIHNNSWLRRYMFGEYKDYKDESSSLK